MTNDITKLAKDKSIEYSSFRLLKNGLEPIGNPTFEDWENCGIFLRHINKSVGFWLGDWLNYGENKYGEKYSQALDETDFAYGTLRNFASVAAHIELSRRRDDLDFKDHTEVAYLDPEEQDKILDLAEKNKLSTRDIRKMVKEYKYNLRQLSPNDLPDGEFDVIYADPPWKYDFSETAEREIENQYPTMEVNDIEQLQIPSADNAVLFLWATAPKLREALKVMESWGFEYKTNMIWDKEIIGMGYWARGQHELLLVGVKGTYPAPPESVRESSVYREQRTSHSKKPDYYYSLIERLCPNGKYLELFARTTRQGWTTWGNDKNATDISQLQTG
jgi:N6-adenosine-specific RNA methylase IME4